MKKTLLTILFILLMFVAGCVTMTRWPPQDPLECNNFPESISIDDKHDQKDCFIYLAEKNADKSLCDNVFAWKNYCLAKYSIGAKDMATCKSLTGTRFNGVLVRDLCLQDISIELEDNSCSEIENDVLRTKCFNSLAIKTNNPDLCTNDDCIYDIAINTSKPEYCLKIKDLPVNCLNRILYASVENGIEQDKSMCELFIDKDKSKNCIELLSKDPNLCTTGHCLFLTAESIEDIDLCEKATSEKERSSCYYNFGVEFREASACEQVLEEEGNLWTSKDLCYNNIAIHVNEISLCEKIKNEDLRNDCISKSEK